MYIRKLEKSDVEFVVEIVRKNYSLLEAKQAKLEILEMFKNGVIKPQYFVAESKGIVGFGGFIKSWMNDGVYNIFWINVAPEEQKKGVGKSLVQKLIVEIKKKKDSKLILLTADTTKGNDKYYGNLFGFKKIESFDSTKDSIMALSIENNN